MGETVDLVCNVTSNGYWTFKRDKLPLNAHVAYSESGMLLRILKFNPSNVGPYTCYSEVKNYRTTHDTVDIEITGTLTSFLKQYYNAY